MLQCVQPVELQVGGIFQVCKSGEVICPVRFPICEDLTLVDVVDTPDGLGLKGISPGATHCSIMSFIGTRRVFLMAGRLNQELRTDKNMLLFNRTQWYERNLQLSKFCVIGKICTE